MSKPLPWISPSDADDMLYDDPMGSLPDFGYALLRKSAKRKQNRVADLARAKLQPSKPNDRDWLADGLWPITCASHRIFTAPGVAVEPGVLEGIFHDYDTKAKAHQKLLAVVLTYRFPHSWQPADILSLVGKYALEKLALQRRLTSMTVVHMPGDELSARRPHAHVVCMARVHRSSGWGEVHPDLVAKTAQARFQQEWEDFYDVWLPLFRDG
ncbi:MULTISPECIES: hypothetical protein [Sphingomonas]|jgi:hypothetical protein|uniref:Uncharacterized protein n=1 Tax=Sphingomonas hankookensis TaxID=563996 RepID=A0ABR5YFR6_9SPHN|nr:MULTISPECIES: hypothetical protein [Sphingomonas]KZE16079.1 hypothetical protein AVT10_12655 [Sphingomonas hankookensis]PZT90549.1 MAG: hypothetical protein DI625_17615 [Sphingomonas sp.]WCP72724.1 hypothetical protein PPZ50_03985 [Sphingomonas hankookensis]